MRGIAIAALFAVLLAGCGSDDEAPATQPPPAAATASGARELAVGDAVVRAEIADDDAERALGLGGRDRLAGDAGMYFVLTSSAPRIWMKGMRFPLDLVWIRDGRVVDVTARVPDEPRGTPESELPVYSPSRPADRVLEVNAGWTERNGVRAGDPVRFANASSG
ncbi:MAG TPA: DUF192 domain-containing protein [Solirubrobacterales bacterium]|nr:DUF192 domain-containing protein [Solirubrobacterales bacterium]